MNPLTEARQEIISALGPLDQIAKVVSYVPERFTPPGIVVIPAQPWVTETETFGHLLARHQVTIVVANGDNETVTNQCDELVWSVLTALVTTSAYVDGVGSPYALEVGGQQFLAVDIDASSPIPLPSKES